MGLSEMGRQVFLGDYSDAMRRRLLEGCRSRHERRCNAERVDQREEEEEKILENKGKAK